MTTKLTTIKISVNRQLILNKEFIYTAQIIDIIAINKIKELIKIV